MEEFFWKMAGADCELLGKSGPASQQRFLIVGWLYCIVTGLLFCAFFGLFLAVFDGFWLAAGCSVVISFLIGNTYRLNMLNLEPPTLRGPDVPKMTIATLFVRYFSVTLFAVFVSKCLETMVFGSLVDTEVQIVLQRKIALGYIHSAPGGTQFVEHLFQLNAHYPWLWAITSAMVILFLLPIVLKFRLDGRNEYFSIKKAVDIRTILTHHETVKALLAEAHRAHYAGYKDLPGMETPVYREHKQRYRDEPFNTDRMEE